MSGSRYLVFAAFVGLLTAGCSSRPDYNASAVESYLHTSQIARFGDQTVGRADCPDNAKMAASVTITCTLAVGGGSVVYDVKLSDADSEHVGISASPKVAQIDAAGAAKYVLASLGANGAGARVGCGKDAIIFVAPGSGFVCTVELGSQVKKVNLTVTDLKGTVRITG